MSPRHVGRRKAAARASELLDDVGVTSPPVPVEEIAAMLKLQVVHDSLPHDTSSVLIRQTDGRQVIGVNSRHSPTRQRFSLAHEIGHSLLHFPTGPPSDGEAVVSRPLEVLFRDGVAGQGTSAVEIDANTFAAALLMPESLVRARLRRRWEQDRGQAADLISADLADEFDVSTQAMRIRLVNLGLADPT